MRGHYCQLVGKNLAWKDVLPKTKPQKHQGDRPTLPPLPTKGRKKVWIEPEEEGLMKAQVAAWAEKQVMINAGDLSRNIEMDFQLLEVTAAAWLREMYEAQHLKILEMPVSKYSSAPEESKKPTQVWYVIPAATSEMINAALFSRLQPYWPSLLKRVFLHTTTSMDLYEYIKKKRTPHCGWAPLPAHVIVDTFVALLLLEGSVTRVPADYIWQRITPDQRPLFDVLCPNENYGTTPLTTLK